jgi:hypothetical protein
MKVVKKVGVLSVARVALVFGIILGIVQGIIYGISAQQMLVQYPQIATMSLADAQAAGGSSAVLTLMTVRLGWWNILAMPVVAAIYLWIAGALVALIYNLIAKVFGGVKIDLV